VHVAFPQVLDHATDHPPEERVAEHVAAGTGDHQRDRPGPAGDERPGRVVGRVPDLLDGRADRVLDVLVDVANTVHHAGHGRP
jgi:hypothetical protein